MEEKIEVVVRIGKARVHAQSGRRMTWAAASAANGNQQRRHDHRQPQ
jgi:hypothetical protein